MPIEPFVAGVLNTGCGYLKQTPASVVRNIGASNRPSLAANFFTPTSCGSKGKTKIVNSDCHNWHSREWICSASTHSIWCSGKTYFPPIIMNVLIR